MNRSDPDARIDAWLRRELDAVPEPTRAVSGALEAAAVTPQRRGRLSWLRQALGLVGTTVQHGSADRPEVVLTPSADGGAGSAAFRRQGAIATPLVLVALIVALTVLGAAAWLTIGPGRELLGGADGTQPMRPIETGPNRSIVVAADDGHFATLAAAVAEAQPGDRIELHPGTYQAEVVIDKDIEIVGVGDRDQIVVEQLPLAEGEVLSDRLRVLFRLQDSDAVLRGFTLRGSENGTAVIIDGGEPLLDGVRIAPEGSMVTGGPSQPRESIDIMRGSPTVRGSELTSLVYVGDGATPVFEAVSFEPGCLMVEGEGARPTLRDTHFVDSECPGFSLSVADGAHLDIAASTISSQTANSGIRVANEGSSADISGTTISGGTEGVLIGPGATVDFRRSNAQGADVGIRVVSAELTVVAGALIDNGIGLQVSGDSFIEVSDTDFCNDADLDLQDGAAVPIEPNRFCADGATELASVRGS